MLNQTSKEFRKFFLLQFTKELIHQSAPEEIFKLEKILQNQKKSLKKVPLVNKAAKEIVKIRERKILDLQRQEEKQEKPINKIKIPTLKKNVEALRKTKPLLKIPKTKLPQTFQYLKPTPTNKEIDLEKLNPLIQDPLVKIIECNGAQENIIVKGAMGTKPTNIVLSKEEIDIIMKRFSEATKIPLHEGIFKAATGKLVLSAIISEVIGSKFIIKKIMYSPRLY